MEMMQITPAGQQKPGSLPGKMPAAKGGDLFHSLLHPLQAAESGEELAGEGDPSIMAAWLAPGFPANMQAGASTFSVEKEVGGSWMSALKTGKNAEDPGALPKGAFTDFPRNAKGLFDLGSLTARQAEGHGAPVSLSGDTENSPAPVKESGFLVQGLTKSGLEAAFGLSGPSIPLHASPAGNGRGGGEPHAAAKGGILEQRFAEILRPAEAVSFRGGGEGNPAIFTTTLPDASPFAGETILPAGLETEVGNSDSFSEVSGATKTGLLGEFDLKGKTGHGDVQQPELRGGEGIITGRMPALSSSPLVTDASALRAPADRILSESQILDQVIGRIAIDRKDESSRMSIKLQPEELGRIEIDLTVEQGRIKAQMVAQNQQVQDVLERHMPRLREALEQQGLKLDTIQVSVNDPAGNDKGFSQQQHRQTDSHPRWHGPDRPVSGDEEREPPLPVVSTLGKLSLRI